MAIKKQIIIGDIMIIVITGPTGVGKTKLSIELAKIYNAEIINADSMQVYKGLNIGTAKIKEEEKEGIIHHLFDIKEPCEEYSIYDYQKDVRKLIQEINNKGKNIIIVGGSALYIKSALYNYKLNENTNNFTYEDLSNEELYQKLLTLDPNIIIDKDNRRRLVRALNYYYEEGKSISDNKQGDELLYDAIFIGLTTAREKLYDIINKRVDQMLNEGLLQEVKQVYEKYGDVKPLIGGIGYKEVISYLKKEITYDEMCELIKKNSRHYAKRQYTFLNNKMDIHWQEVNFNDFNQTINKVKEYIDKTILHTK